MCALYKSFQMNFRPFLRACKHVLGPNQSIRLNHMLDIASESSQAVILG